MELHS